MSLTEIKVAPIALETCKQKQTKQRPTDASFETYPRKTNLARMLRQQIPGDEVGILKFRPKWIK